VSQQTPSFEQSNTPLRGEETSNPFFTISNLLSISRAVLAIPFAIVMLSDSPHARWWGIFILALATLTDKLDGVVARKYNQVTEWGKILDPLADKIGMAIVAMVLVKRALIPLWFVLGLVGRDLLILAGGIYIKRSRGLVLQSNQLGKWTIGALALTMFTAMLRWTTATDIFLWLCVAMLAGSLVLYARRFVEVMKSQTLNPET
jgi:CDP-diacylglycerol--glycerol-3-phosphate 3-phosphatidyltransferase